MKTTFLFILSVCMTWLMHSQCNSYAHDNVWNESWESCTPASNPALTGTTNHWIQYDLGQVFKIDSLHLWNYNVDSNAVNKGVKDFSIYTSIDSMVWMSQGTFTASPGTGSTNYLGQSFDGFQPFDAKYLVFNIEDNHGASCSAISEVLFGIDYGTCADFQPSVSIEYEVCAEEFYLEAISLDPTESYNFLWSTNESSSMIVVPNEGSISLKIDDGTCTKVYEISLKKPSILLNGWSSGNEIPTGEYFSDQEIQTSGSITEGDEVQLYMAGGVDLLEDFEVSEDGLLEIHLVDCQSNASYFVSQEVISHNNSIVNYTDYLGNGHDYGIQTISSSTGDAHTTISGLGPLNEVESYRFLTQATFGATEAMASELSEIDMEQWLEWQTNIPHESYFNHLYFVMKYDQPSILYWTNWHRTWWHNILTGDNYLRDRMAFALSQILVISSKSFILNFGDGLTEYYDILAKNAFGNYRDLLYEVTLNPMMGFYLSHMNNPKTDVSKNQFPDENFAREILQLFSIGLYELNIDGTRKKDSQGNDIPTYSNADIIEYAKVFTGLGTSGRPFGMKVNLVANKDIKSYMTEPMVMHEEHHEQGPKKLLRGETIPAGQIGMEDISDAIDNIFNHPNVGPFIGRQLIQRFVKSDPTSSYVQRVAETFNNNGSGIRGDMKAVIVAVLMDEEARDCSWISNSDHGKMKEPLLRFSQLYKAFDIQSTTGTFYSEGLSIEESTGQGPLRSPSVFNFYQTNYSPPGILSDAMLDAPEFQILNSSTSIGYINMLDSIIVQGMPLELEKGVSSLDFTTELTLVNDHNVLVEHLNTKLCNGTMKAKTKATIITALNQLTSGNQMEKIKLAVYLATSSPEYVILK